MDWKYDNLLEADEWFPCNWVYSDQENSQEENQLASCGEIRNAERMAGYKLCISQETQAMGFWLDKMRIRISGV